MAKSVAGKPERNRVYFYEKLDNYIDFMDLCDKAFDFAKKNELQYSDVIIESEMENGYYDEKYSYMVIRGSRMQTNKEYQAALDKWEQDAKRLAKSTADARKKKKEEEKALYEKLKAKYGNE